MAKRTPTIISPDGRQLTVARIHPARFSEAHIELFHRLVDHEAALLGRTVRVLDPMAGVGNIHQLHGHQVDTTAQEIEAPYVAVAHQLWPERSTVQGDAGRMVFADGAFDAVIVSPDFGNRLADHHQAKDPCRCRKVFDSTGLVIEVRPNAEPGCSVCSGSGRSLRRSYPEDLRRLTGDDAYTLAAASSSGSYAWQPAYWARQEAYWQEAHRVLRPGGLMVVDVKDVVRAKRVVPVVAGHRTILQALGFTIEGELPLAADGLRYGENRELRVDGHIILTGRRAAATVEVAA